MMSITNTFLMIIDSDIIEEKPYCEGTVPYAGNNFTKVESVKATLYATL